MNEITSFLMTHANVIGFYLGFSIGLLVFVLVLLANVMMIVKLVRLFREIRR